MILTKFYAILLSLILAGLNLTGCQRPAARSQVAIVEPTQPMVDPNALSPAEIVIAGQVRTWPQRLAYIEKCGVPHGPVYLAIKYDDTTAYPVEFELWSCTDIKATCYSPAQAAISLLRLPCDLWHYPPGHQQVSRSIYPPIEPAYEMTAVTAIEECHR